MTKADMTANVMNTTGGKKAEAETIVEQLITGMTEALAAGEKVDLRGLGVLKVREAKARTARNPKTGETIQVPAKRKVVFTASKELKGRLA